MSGSARDYALGGRKNAETRRRSRVWSADSGTIALSGEGAEKSGASDGTVAIVEQAPEDATGAIGHCGPSGCVGLESSDPPGVTISPISAPQPDAIRAAAEAVPEPASAAHVDAHSAPAPAVGRAMSANSAAKVRTRFIMRSNLTTYRLSGNPNNTNDL